jgi:hypothetical protein
MEKKRSLETTMQLLVNKVHISFICDTYVGTLYYRLFCTTNVLRVAIILLSAEIVKSLQSLSGSCEMFLGKPLHKGQQMSNWELRPLSQEQLTYASLDAHATLSLLDAMMLARGVQSGLGIVQQHYTEAPVLAIAPPCTNATTSPTASPRPNAKVGSSSNSTGKVSSAGPKAQTIAGARPPSTLPARKKHQQRHNQQQQQQQSTELPSIGDLKIDG